VGKAKKINKNAVLASSYTGLECIIFPNGWVVFFLAVLLSVI
jgi:hypothetical protein